MRSSRRYSLIFAVYAESTACCAAALADSSATSANARRVALWGLCITASERNCVRGENSRRNTAAASETLVRRAGEPHARRHDYEEDRECSSERQLRHALCDARAEIGAEEQAESDPQRRHDSDVPFLIVGPRAECTDRKQEGAQGSAGSNLRRETSEEDECGDDDDAAADAEHTGEHASKQADCNVNEVGHGDKFAVYSRQ